MRLYTNHTLSSQFFKKLLFVLSISIIAVVITIFICKPEIEERGLEPTKISNLEQTEINILKPKTIGDFTVFLNKNEREYFTELDNLLKRERFTDISKEKIIFQYDSIKIEMGKNINDIQYEDMSYLLMLKIADYYCKIEDYVKALKLINKFLRDNSSNYFFQKKEAIQDLIDLENENYESLKIKFKKNLDRCEEWLLNLTPHDRQNDDRANFTYEQMNESDEEEVLAYQMDSGLHPKGSISCVGNLITPSVNSRLFQAKNIVPYIENALKVVCTIQQKEQPICQSAFRFMESNKATVLIKSINKADALQLASPKTQISSSQFSHYGKHSITLDSPGENISGYGIEGSDLIAIGTSFSTYFFNSALALEIANEKKYLTKNSLQNYFNNVNNSGKTYALLIGINDYKNVKDLHYSINDVNLLKETLENNYSKTPNNLELTTLTDKDATKQNILQTLKNIKAQVKPTDNILIYFVGHGNEMISRSTENDIIPKQSKSKTTSQNILPYEFTIGKANSYISIDSIHELFKDANTENPPLLIVDACRTIDGIKDDVYAYELNSANIEPRKFIGSDTLNIFADNNAIVVASIQKPDKHCYSDANLYGHIAYYKDDVQQYEAEEGSFALRLNRDTLDPLPATLEEVKAIEEICIYSKVPSILLTINKAKEDTIKYFLGTRAPSIIHFATHGIKKEENITASLIGQDRFRTADNPLQRSLLMLSNTREIWQKRDPNITSSENTGTLTALEVANLDLSNTELVVLSACNTGIDSKKEKHSIDYKLDVCGIGRFKETLVEEDWFDYVLEPEYCLTTLEEESISLELAAHIIRNSERQNINCGHFLPESIFADIKHFDSGGNGTITKSDIDAVIENNTKHKNNKQKHKPSKKSSKAIRPKLIVLNAASAGDKSFGLRKINHGVFTYNLVNSLKKGFSVDLNKDNYVSLQESKNDIDKGVQKTKNNRAEINQQSDLYFYR